MLPLRRPAASPQGAGAPTTPPTPTPRPGVPRSPPPPPQSDPSSISPWLRARAAAAATAASALVLFPTLIADASAAPTSTQTRLPPPPPLTQEERRAIDLFERSRVSVVNVTNLASRRDLYTTQLLEVPQGAGSGVIWSVPDAKEKAKAAAATTTPPASSDDDPAVGAVVVTNFHVVADSSDVRVSLYGGAEYAAKVVGADPDRDIAVLRLTRRADLLPPPGMALPPGGLGSGGGGSGNSGSGNNNSCEGGSGGIPCSGKDKNSDNNSKSTPSAAAPATPPPPAASSSSSSGLQPRLPPRQAPPSSPLVQPPRPLKAITLCAARPGGLSVGQRVYAIGAPFNLTFTFTSGIVGGIGREIQSISGRPILGAIQHDAPINPGSSGGPLLDTGGCFVGTNTAILSPSGASAGVGFAIPSELVASSVQQILDNGRVVRPVLGLSFAPDSSAEQLGVRGILVLSAREGGPAWRAGVRGTQRDDFGRLVLGDIVVAVDGAPVRSSSDLYAALDKSGVGKEMELTLLRGSETVTVSATLDPSS